MFAVSSTKEFLAFLSSAIVVAMFLLYCGSTGDSKAGGTSETQKGKVLPQCGRFITEYQFDGSLFQIILYRFDSCEISLPDLTQKGYFIGLVSSSGMAILTGQTVDPETSLDIIYVDIDGDGIDEIVCIDSDADNRSGHVFRFKVRPFMYGSFQRISIPNVIVDMMFGEDTTAVQVQRGNTIRWPGSVTLKDSAYIVFYDTLGDSLALKKEPQ